MVRWFVEKQERSVLRERIFSRSEDFSSRAAKRGQSFLHIDGRPHTFYNLFFNVRVGTGTA